MQTPVHLTPAHMFLLLQQAVRKGQIKETKGIERDAFKLLYEWRT